MKELRAHLPGIPVVFLANKCDLAQCIDEQSLQKMGTQVGALKTFETSALNGANVQEAFCFLAGKLLE